MCAAIYEINGKRWVVDPLFSAEEIQVMVRRLAEQLSQDYAGQPVTLVCVLEGAKPFFAGLQRFVTIRDLTLDTIAVSSYEGTESSGVVRLARPPSYPFAGRHVVIIDEIVDSGGTAKFLLEYFASRQALSVRTCCLLSKPSRRRVAVRTDCVGREIDDVFVVGYGLDYCGKLRELPYIGILRELSP